MSQKIHETGIFICFSLSGLWVRARQKTSSESKILIKKTVSFKGRKTKHRNHVGKDFKADGILWLFLNNSGFRSVKELVYSVIFSQLFFLNLFGINASFFFLSFFLIKEAFENLNVNPDNFFPSLSHNFCLVSLGFILRLR